MKMRLRAVADPEALREAEDITVDRFRALEQFAAENALDTSREGILRVQRARGEESGLLGLVEGSDAASNVWKL